MDSSYTSGFLNKMIVNKSFMLIRAEAIKHVDFEMSCHCRSRRHTTPAAALHASKTAELM